MKCTAPSFVSSALSPQRGVRRLGGIALSVFGVLVSGTGSAQRPPGPAAHPQRVSHDANVSSSELPGRLKAANEARDHGDPIAVAHANELVLASALRELADLRSIGGDYLGAMKLYGDSLTFEDRTETRLDLATAASQAGHYDQAMKLAEDVRSSGSKDIRTDRILGSSLVQKGQFAPAIPYFERIADAEPTVPNLYALTNCLLQTRVPANKVRAAVVIQQMEAIAGNTGSLHVLLGRAYRDAGDMNSAVHEFETAIQIDPRTPHAHYFLGLAKLALNEWKPTPDAEAEMKKEVQYFPRDYLGNYMVGFLESGERRYAEARPYLEAAASIDPTVPEPSLYLGLDAYAEGDMAVAEQMLRKAVVLTGDDEARSNFQIRRAYVDLGRILSSSGRKEESELFLTKARALQNKTMEQSQQSIATMAQASGAGPTAAVMPLVQQDAASKTGAESSPSSTSGAGAAGKLTASQHAEIEQQEKLLRGTLGLAFNDLATSEAIRGAFPRALGHYQQAEQWDSNLAGLKKNLGQSAFRSGEYADAIPALSAALRQQSENAALRGMLGISYFNLDQYSKAAEVFAPLGSRGMQDDEIGYAWAASLAHTGDMKRASEVLLAFSSTPRPADVMLLIGQLWTAIGDFPRATSTLRQALLADPTLRRAHLDSGLAYIRWEHWPEAAKEFEAELALSPGDPDATYHLGYVAMQQSKFDDALDLFQKVVATYPTYANAQYQLGKILLDRGQVNEAVVHLEAAARSSPQTDYIHYQLQAAYRKQHRPEQAEQELEKYKQLKAASREHVAAAVNVNPQTGTN